MLPVGHILGIPVEETLGSLTPTLAMAGGAIVYSFRRLLRRGGRARTVRPPRPHRPASRIQ